MSKHVVVLGAGPAGLGAALELIDRGYKVTLVEAQPFAGGAGATQTIKGCLVDYGPHLFHPTTPEITDLMRRFSDGKYFQEVMINRIILKGKVFHYPFRMGEAATKLNPFLNLRILIDYLYMKVKTKIKPKPIKTFEDWGLQSFGRTLYNLCFGYYTARVWGRDPKTISARLAKEKLSALSLRKIIINFLRRAPQTEGYLGVRQFGYHPDGIGKIYRNMADHIAASGGTVLYNTSLHRMDVKNNHVHTITVRTGDKEQTIEADAVISTIPLTSLFAGMRVPPAIRKAARLEYRDILFVNYIIKRNQYSPAHMIYLLDTKFTSNRVAEQKNVTSKAAPKGKTLLTYEVPCQRGDKLWENEALVYSKVLEDMRLMKIEPHEVADKFILRYTNAYPVFNLGYEKDLELVKSYLSKFDNLYIAGRQGLYLNIDMHDSIRLGRLAAAHVIEEDTAKTWIPRVDAFLATLKL
jgi:protoporphyrinogen oxidase